MAPTSREFEKPKASLLQRECDVPEPFLRSLNYGGQSSPLKVGEEWRKGWDSNPR